MSVSFHSILIYIVCNNCTVCYQCFVSASGFSCDMQDFFFFFLATACSLSVVKEIEWQPTPVILPGKSYGQRDLVDYSPLGHKELDTI